MNFSDSTHEWLAYAEHDYQAALFLLKARPIPFEIIAFHCQQSAEKYLKAVLVSADVKVPRIHDLVMLNKAAQTYLPGISSTEDSCYLLTPFGTLSRYPGSPLAIDSSKMDLIVSGAKHIRKMVRDFYKMDD